MAITQALKRNVQQRANGLATIFGARRRRWPEFLDRVARLAAGLRALGVQTGDRVAILALNSDRYFEYFGAVPWAGAVLVPINTRWSAAEVVYALSDCTASVLLVDDALAAMVPAIRAGVPGLRQVIFTGDGTTPAGTTNYETLIETHPPIAD